MFFKRALCILCMCALSHAVAMAQNSDPPAATTSLLNPWSASNSGLDSDSVFALIMDSFGTAFAGTEDGVYRSFDNGDSWEGTDIGVGDDDISSLAADPLGVLYVATHGNGAFRSLDNGDTWESISAGLPSLDIGEVAVDDLGVLYAIPHLGAIYRSSDSGDTWEEVQNSGLGNPFVPSLVINPNDVVFSGTDEGVVRSFDEGDTWEFANTGLDNLIVESMAVSRDDVLFAGTHLGIYRSFNDGDNWEAVHDSTLGDHNIRSLVTNPTFALFAGTHDAGVFLSLDHGTTWSTLNDGLDNLDVHALAIAPDGSLLAGTIGGGVFKRDASTDVSNETIEGLPKEFTLEENYPNPFNPTTRIRYALPVQSQVNLSVYDITGRLITVLVNAQQAAGQYEVSFDAATLSSGVYFYRLEAGAFSEMQQMVLLR